MHTIAVVAAALAVVFSVVYVLLAAAGMAHVRGLGAELRRRRR